MKRTGYLFFLLIIYTYQLFCQTHITPGDVNGLWTLQNSPYIVQGNITIPNYTTLTIEPGVLVEFQGHYFLNVQGRLLAEGTKTDSIIFTINDTTGFSNPDIPSGGWHGIRFNWTPLNNDTSKIIYCKLNYGKAVGPIPENMGGAIFVDHYSKLIISNCTISCNFANSSGGGIYLYYSSPEITGNMISNNSAASAGGIACSDGSDAKFYGNIIANNYANRGGGIVIFYAKPILSNTIIENNKSQFDGGGVLILDKAKPVFKNVKVNGNTAGSGGGIHSFLSDLKIDSSEFSNNSGCAIRYDCGLTANDYFSLNINNTLFSGNTSKGNRVGCISVEQQDSASISVSIDKCTFTNNKSGSYSCLAFEGKYLDFTIHNSRFSHNEAAQRNTCGLFTSHCSGTISNCLFDSNASSGSYYGFGCIAVMMNARVDLWNCTFAYNTASIAAGLFVTGGGNASINNCIFWGNHENQIMVDTLNNLGGNLAINYCDIQDGKDSVKTISNALLDWGDGNIELDPLFRNPILEDYHLQNGSPCISAGINTININNILQYCPCDDIDCNKRPYPEGSMPDIGAYESPEGLVSVELLTEAIPLVYTLEQNYPNPFNQASVIKYQIPFSGNVKLIVYDALGRKSAVLVNEEQPAGIYKINWDAGEFSSGIYFYRLQAGQFTETKKMILLR